MFSNVQTIIQYKSKMALGNEVVEKNDPENEEEVVFSHFSRKRQFKFFILNHLIPIF